MADVLEVLERLCAVQRLLAALQSFGVRLPSDVDPSEFPAPDQAARWRKLGEEATREWEEEQEVWRRLEEHRNPAGRDSEPSPEWSVGSTTSGAGD